MTQLRLVRGGADDHDDERRAECIKLHPVGIERQPSYAEVLASALLRAHAAMLITGVLWVVLKMVF